MNVAHSPAQSNRGHAFHQAWGCEVGRNSQVGLLVECQKVLNLMANGLTTSQKTNRMYSRRQVLPGQHELQLHAMAICSKLNAGMAQPVQGEHLNNSALQCT